MKIANLFKPGTHAFWGTTYTLGLALFDQYLLRRLGGPPLNAVLLADHWKLGEMWDRLDPEEHYLARQANRLYLMRGIRYLAAVLSTRRLTCSRVATKPRSSSARVILRAKASMRAKKSLPPSTPAQNRILYASRVGCVDGSARREGRRRATDPPLRGTARAVSMDGRNDRSDAVRRQ